MWFHSLIKLDFRLTETSPELDIQCSLFLGFWLYLFFGGNMDRCLHAEFGLQVACTYRQFQHEVFTCRCQWGFLCLFYSLESKLFYDTGNWYWTLLVSDSVSFPRGEESSPSFPHLVKWKGKTCSGQNIAWLCNSVMIMPFVFVSGGDDFILSVTQVFVYFWWESNMSRDNSPNRTKQKSSQENFDCFL